MAEEPPGPTEEAAVTEEPPYPTVVVEELPCPTKDAVMEEEEKGPDHASQISLSFIEGKPRPPTLQHPASKHGSNPHQDQNASISVEMNVDDEPHFVIHKKTWKGVVGPGIGMNVARIFAALAKKPFFFLD